MTEPAGSQQDPSAPEVPGVSGDAKLHDLGGDIGASPASSRGGGGLSPQEVREADEHARTAGKDEAGGAG